MTPAFLDTLRQILRAAPQTAIPVGLNRIPDPSAWPPRDYILSQLIGADGDLQEQITELAESIGPALNPARRIYLTKNADDPFGGNLQTAIDAASALVPPPSEAAPVVVDILSPGEYVGNFVVPPHVYIASLTGSPSFVVALTSSSGVTLTMPQQGSGIQGITVLSSSPNAADAALLVVPGGTGNPSLVVIGNIVTTAGATAVRVSAGVTELVVVIVCGINGVTAGSTVELLGGGLLSLLTVMTNDLSGGLVSVTGGGLAILLTTTMIAAGGGAGWLMDADAGSIFAFGPVRYFSASNLVRGRNGAFLSLLDVTGPSNPTGTSLDLDATSVAQIGNFIGSPGSASAYSGWVVAAPGNVAYLPTLGWGIGTTVAPDQRPAAPQPGMRWFATDRAAGTEQLTFNGTVWVDQTGAVVP